MGEMQTTADGRPYWENADYAGANQIVRANLKLGCRAVITMGYYLKCIRENSLYRAGGYKSFGEYVKTECGLTETAASRSISQMEKFSEGGNSPKLAKKWEDFSISKLQEILYLTDEQRETVTPDMTVKEIREIRRPEPLPEPEEVIVTAAELPAEPEETPPAPLMVEGNIEDMLPDAPEPVEPDEFGSQRCITGKSGSGFCSAAAYCTGPALCCADCSESCNIRCGWLSEKKAESLATSQEIEMQADIQRPEDILSEREANPAENEPNTPEPEQNDPESEQEVPVYDKGILLEMIEEVESFLNNMDDDWRRETPAWFTRQAMSLEAYHLLLDKHEAREEIEKTTTVCCGAEECLHRTPDGNCGCGVLWINEDGTCEDMACKDEWEEEE